MPIDATCFAGASTDSFGNSIQTGRYPALANLQVAVGGTSTQSAAFPDTCALVRLATDVICRFDIGLNPTATSTSPRLAAGATEYVAVIPGHRIAVISST
jgi:hypothetical protein